MKSKSEKSEPAKKEPAGKQPMKEEDKEPEAELKPDTITDESKTEVKND